MFSIVELATAMPRAGGVYYFIDRSLGPLVGTIGGLGTWLALLLKIAFADGSVKRIREITGRATIKEGYSV